MHQGPALPSTETSQQCQFVTISMALFDVVQSTFNFRSNIEGSRSQL